MPSKNNPKPPTKLAKFYEYLIYSVPALLYLSYHPRLLLGQTASMNLELSLPLIWLVIFVATSLLLTWRKNLFKPLLAPKRSKFLLLAFPLYATLTTLWSLNRPRAILTAGILWLLYFAVLSILLLAPRVIKTPNFKQNFLRWFFISSLLACLWCWLQCLLDIAGTPQQATLLCDGCVSTMFGFPHPSGFAIEPQFMGNLLLAPAILSFYFMFHNKKYLPLAFIFVATLFLTFSRGAIYAFLIAAIFLTFFELFKTKKFKILLIWPLIICAFLFTLNAQGIMAELGPTNDTYKTGVTKVLNHLSLGVIDLNKAPSSAASAISNEEKPDATFDGYVAESTDVRLKLTNDALELWRASPKNLIFGVGLGSAGQALYEANKSPAPKEIIQNEYTSLLLETGLVGVTLAAITLIYLLTKLLKSANPKNGSAPLAPVLVLLLAYAITLCFFSGLPNALQIYLLPALIYLPLRLPPRRPTQNPTNPSSNRHQIPKTPADTSLPQSA